MKSFWRDLQRPFFILAPMEAVTDVVFRHVVAQAASPDVYFTEFTNATGWVQAGEKAIGGRLVKTSDEQPLVAQLWGGKAADIAILAKHCRTLGFDGIDINMGCPDKSAIKAGGGADLIRHPTVASDIIHAAKQSELPVSVKTRLGYSKTDEWSSWIAFLLQQDIEALTIHLRTKKEMSAVPAHWEIIPAIKALRDQLAPQTLLIGNGDVQDRLHGQTLIDQTGIDGIMIGRGIFHNPFGFENTKQTHTRHELVELLSYHLDMYQQYHHLTRRPYESLKRFFKVYIRDFDGASELRHQLMQTTSVEEVRNILKLT